MYAEERQQAIAADVSRRGRLSVNEIAEQFEVTTETVRRDLTVLERAGVVRRVHGGVVAADSLSMIEAAVAERDSAHAKEKDAIAVAALELLPDEHATILVDAGTTTIRMAALLPRDRRFTVVTHAVPIAARVSGLQHIELRLLPGRVRDTTQAAVGSDTVATLAGLRADIAFLGTNGFTAGHGLTTPDAEEAATKSALVRSAATVVVLTDSSKIGIETTHRFAETREIDVLVTDAGITHDDRAALEKTGLEVRIA
ncbi:MAG: DeoR/GlpR transcriptional regulator [Nocardioidaceae bacterium]|nr:DeoR/GlpR transcriptional regulator [Nocardioidaceae bacterium]